MSGLNEPGAKQGKTRQAGEPHVLRAGRREEQVKLGRQSQAASLEA